MATERRTQLQPAPLSKQASGPDQLATLDESGSLLELANESQAEQTALLEASPVALQYSAALAAQVEAKHEQVERIEDKLEAIVQQQSATMRQMLSARPGVFSLPASRARWQQQVQRQGMIMQRLQGRLELVREIKESMGPHGSRIEELAARKIRAQEPQLVDDWHEALQVQRRHEALIRNQEKEKRQALERERGIAAGARSGARTQTLDRPGVV